LIVRAGVENRAMVEALGIDVSARSRWSLRSAAWPPGWGGVLAGAYYGNDRFPHAARRC